MRLQSAIFDMDGTLVDSMPMWRSRASALVQSHGLVPPPDLDKRVNALSVWEGCALCKELCGLPGTPEELAAEVGVGGVLSHAAGELGGDFTPELRRGGPGIGDDEEVVYVVPLLRHVAEEAVHQDPGLAGPGGGGDQKAPAPVLYGGLLLGGEGHVSPPPFR